MVSRFDLRKRSEAGGRAALCVPPTPSARYASPRPLPLLFRPRVRFIFHLSCAVQMERPYERTEPFVGQNGTMARRR